MKVDLKEHERLDDLVLDGMKIIQRDDQFCFSLDTVLLANFGEASEPCGNCDVCLDPPELWDGTLAARKALSAALRTGQRFGTGHLIDLLRGKANEKMREYGHDTLPTFGVGRELDDHAWRSVFRQLLAAGYLESDVHAYGAIRLTEAARPLLKGEQTLTLRRSALRAGAGGNARTLRTSAAAASVASADAPLYAALRAWRAEPQITINFCARCRAVSITLRWPRWKG